MHITIDVLKTQIFQESLDWESNIGITTSVFPLMYLWSPGELGGSLEYSSNDPGAGDEMQDPDVFYYRKKLQDLRAMCGLDKAVSVGPFTGSL